MKRSPLKRKTPLRSKNPKRIAAGQASQRAQRLKRGIPDDAPRDASGRRCVEVTCGVCGKTYLAWWSQRAVRKTCSKECAAQWKRQHGRNRRGAANPNYKNGARVGARDREGERRWYATGSHVCEHPDCPDLGMKVARHHVVYDQKVRREGGDRWDPRNGLSLCFSCHTSHHQRGTRVVPLAALSDANYAFAFDLLGAAAYDYLRRRYRGDDPRLERFLERFYLED